MDDRVKSEHPSYGVALAHRVSGGRDVLFGSNIRHSHTVRLTISRASKDWHLHEDWIHAEKELIEVEFSPVQWAELITNMNVCPGAPCTIRFVRGEGHIESPPDEKTVTEKYRDEFAASCKKVVGRLSTQMKAIQDILDNKKTINQADRKVIAAALDLINMELKSNMPFVHQQFDEAVEKTTTQAKGEIEAFWTHSIMAMGMKGIKDMLPKPEVIALEMDKDRPALTFEESK